VQNIRQFDDFIKIQMACFASFSSISTIEKEMKLLGYNLSKNTLMSYLKYAFDASLLFEADRLNAAPASRLRYPRKLYAVDHGLPQAMSFSLPDDNERILKNIIFMELCRRHVSACYHGGKNECDFIIRTNGAVSECLQVCYSLGNSDSAELKIKNLCAVLDSYKLGSGIVLTNDEQVNMERDGKTIYVRPAWFFAIEQPEV
jgi:predicted AAA+ superfamily ATPase